MPNPPVAALMMLVSAAAAGTPVPAGRMTGTEVAQITFRERIIIRVPSRMSRADDPAREADPQRPVEWVEKKGPKCVTANQLGGAIVSGDYVDLVLRGGDRVRAQLDGDCSGLGFYGGFYLKPSADGQICAGRDTIRTRSGDRCRIKRFRKLVAKR